MKLFYKKDYLREIEKSETLKEALEIRKNEIAELKDSLKYKEEQLKREKAVSDEISNELLKSSEELKKALGAKGGLTKENNKLKNQVEELTSQNNELKQKLEESMTDKYLVKKVPSGRTPNTLKTKVSVPMKSSVRKYMKEEFEQ